ncbi:MAG: LPS export ABC transporter periplasmic protein LptC [Pseudazoarcus pumilus]|nr:LPS export ABC transporter periplasmic protein LptC [Pseudazoarcus pumilus]
MNVDRFYPIIALAFLAAGTLWLERVTRAPEIVQQADRTHPDFIGDNVRVARFDTDGRLAYELDADRITHYPASDITDLERPHLRYHSERGETSAMAARGETGPDGEVVDLRGEVVVLRKSHDGDDLIIESETLSVWPDAQKASTDSPVVLKNGNITAYGDGMRADNLAGTLDLVGAARVLMPSSRRTRP